MHTVSFPSRRALVSVCLVLIAALTLPSENVAAAESVVEEAAARIHRGEYREAEPFARQALAEAEAASGTESEATAVALRHLAGALHGSGKLDEARPVYERALAISELTPLGATEFRARTLHNLALLERDSKRSTEAISRFSQAIEAYEAIGAGQSAGAAEALASLGAIHLNQGRFVQAEPHLRRAFELREARLGIDHESSISALLNLAKVHAELARFSEAETELKKAVAASERVFGPNHVRVGEGLYLLGTTYKEWRRYSLAIPALTRALEVLEPLQPRDVQRIGEALNALGAVLSLTGERAEGERLFRRAIATYGSDSAYRGAAASTRINLANNLAHWGRKDEAVPVYEEAISALEQHVGPQHPSVGDALGNLAIALRDLKRFDRAESVQRRSLAIREATRGPTHPSVANSLNVLAIIYREAGRFDEAEPLLQRSLKIRELTYGPQHTQVAVAHSNLATLYRRAGRTTEALEAARRSSAIYLSTIDDIALDPRIQEEAGAQRWLRLAEHLELLALAREQVDARLVGEAFEIGQLTRTSELGVVVAQMAARHARADDRQGRLARDRQDAAQRLVRVETELVRVFSQPSAERDAKRESAAREQQVTLRRQLRELDLLIEKEFPRYAELTSARPMALAETQRLLAPNEAMVSFVIGVDSVFAWAVRRDRAHFVRLTASRKRVEELVRHLRSALDPGDDPAGILSKPFPVLQAFTLYEALLAPIEPHLDGADHLLVVPDGALQSLPFGVLVTKKPASPLVPLNELSAQDWLIKRYAVSTLPTESTLRALRAFATGPAGPVSFGGFGDPVLEGTGHGRSASVAASTSRGAIADVDEVRKLARLPETAIELRRIAQVLKADPANLYLAERGTETQVKALDLTRFAALSFATHGIVAGALTGVAEPALVLSPPAKGTELDDGLLTASEVSTLKLNADWVILSACNTSAGDGTPGAAGLSGLSKAFFYAGARSLVVSHWAVGSDATVALMTEMFARYARGASKAESLRQSMLALMQRPAVAQYAHPLFWAPFFVVGEGAAPPRRD